MIVWGGGPPATPATAGLLVATLYPLVRTLLVLTEDSPTVTAVAGTRAALTDGLDASGADLIIAGTGGGPVPIGRLDEEWQLDPLSYSGPVSRLELVARLWLTDESGNSASVVCVPRMSGTLVGAAAGVLSIAAVNRQRFDVDPADGHAWTKARVNTKRFGFRLDGGGGPDPADTGTGRVCEFSVQVFG